MEKPASLEELKDIMLDTQRLVIETNERLKVQEAKRKRDIRIKLLWYFVIFILPMIIFYWYLAPIYKAYLSPGTATDNQDQIEQINNLLQGI